MTPSRPTLTDALAAALDATPREWGRFKVAPCIHGDPCTESACPEYGRSVYAAAILADPAFREALTAALAEALRQTMRATVARNGMDLYPQEAAAAIVAAMLPDERP